MHELINTWKDGKRTLGLSGSTEQLIARAKEQQRQVLYAHYATIAVLSATLVLLALFFYFKAPLTTLLSRAGITLMLGGLLLRIIVEIVSIRKSKQIRLVNDASDTTNSALLFYQFRRRIHGPVTIAIVLGYIIGFYCLSPEFSLYLSFPLMVFMHLSFPIGALFLLWVIRKGIRDEMESLLRLLELKKEMTDSAEVDPQ